MDAAVAAYLVDEEYSLNGAEAVPAPDDPPRLAEALQPEARATTQAAAAYPEAVAGSQGWEREQKMLASKDLWLN
ncbi:hypothetical protein [Acidovorax sp. SUPP3334]|uniref:hypothetical protein n=1 Tax=Acidovorax sp. SUPP3334 TaxID=2920881 RepID=UPI0023DE4BA0|nr:hypothetical protein [Acidovorax sp. SUPP3334]GKT24729.1 hypothetical protein AVHM3334_15670 [Acidovorax sp. SUPP3334]